MENSSLWPPKPVILRGAAAILEPLSLEHVDALKDAVRDGELWKSSVTLVPSPDAMTGYVRYALTELDEGKGTPFVVVEAQSKRIVGTTRFRNVDSKRHRLEIGFTWYARAVQGTAMNSESKYLLLQYAFEGLSAEVVEWRVHMHNFRSRQAVERLGAKHDGRLRKLIPMPDGSLADADVFSVTSQEWPGVKSHLKERTSRLLQTNDIPREKTFYEH